MSVMYLKPEIYQDCEATLRGNGFTTNGSGTALYSFLDWNYYDAEPFTPFQKLFNELYLLNALSFADRYNGDIQTPPMLNFSKGKRVSNWQLLKYLECIDYQIEIENNPNVDTLKKLIEELKSRLISLIPGYKNAKWGE
ncbi:MAG: hypothetical protein IPJ03_15850 [Ignavibacteriales bacterium]|nr:hypothetical protein [Ignavibacteriales bacterium]